MGRSICECQRVDKGKDEIKTVSNMTRNCHEILMLFIS